MKTNSKVKTKKRKAIVGNNDSFDSLGAQGVANGQLILNPDYSSMKKEIQKIKDPVSFKGLKRFYNLG